MALTTEQLKSLTEVMTAAVVCASAPAAWLTLWYERKDKHEERRHREFQTLAAVEREVDDIERWAGREYDDSSHDVQWFNPYWSVVNFPSARIEAFPLTTAAQFFGQDLTDSIGDLVAAIHQFRALLEGHNQLLLNTDEGLKQRVLSAVQPHFPEFGGSGLSLEDVDSLSALTPNERAWLREVYRLNKEVHTFGIGSVSEPNRLFVARRRAAESIVSARQPGPQDPVHPGLAFLGHVLAGAFALAGTYLFVLAVGLVFRPDVDSGAPPPPSAQPAAPLILQAPTADTIPTMPQAGEAPPPQSDSTAESSATDLGAQGKPATHALKR